MTPEEAAAAEVARVRMLYLSRLPRLLLINTRTWRAAAGDDMTLEEAAAAEIARVRLSVMLIAIAK